MENVSDEIKGNGKIGIKRSLSCSDDEDGFLGFNTGKITRESYFFVESMRIFEHSVKCI